MVVITESLSIRRCYTTWQALTPLISRQTIPYRLGSPVYLLLVDFLLDLNKH